MKFAFFTLGCKVNLFETQALSQLAAERGHEIVDSGSGRGHHQYLHGHIVLRP